MARDEFESFQAEMARRAYEAQVEIQAEPRAAPDDDMLMTMMSKIKLQRGQMLIVGPKSVAILLTPGSSRIKLPDTYILDKPEWSVVERGTTRRRT